MSERNIIDRERDDEGEAGSGGIIIIIGESGRGEISDLLLR